MQPAAVFGDDRGLLDGGRGMVEADDKVSEKQRLRQLEEEADFENAQGMFDMSIAKKKDVPAEGSIETFVARTAADAEVLAEKVAAKLTQFENMPWFVEMSKSLIKKLTTNLSADDAKEIASTTQVISNDKLKSEREKQKGKKKGTVSKKAAIKETHNSAYDNTDEYVGDDYDDNYDFM